MNRNEYLKVIKKVMMKSENRNLLVGGSTMPSMIRDEQLMGDKFVLNLLLESVRTRIVVNGDMDGLLLGLEEGLEECIIELKKDIEFPNGDRLCEDDEKWPLYGVAE